MEKNMFLYGIIAVILVGSLLFIMGGGIFPQATVSGGVLSLTQVNLLRGNDIPSGFRGVDEAFHGTVNLGVGASTGFVYSDVIETDDRNTEAQNPVDISFEWNNGYCKYDIDASSTTGVDRYTYRSVAYTTDDSRHRKETSCELPNYFAEPELREYCEIDMSGYWVSCETWRGPDTGRKCMVYEPATSITLAQLEDFKRGFDVDIVVSKGTDNERINFKTNEGVSSLSKSSTDEKVFAEWLGLASGLSDCPDERIAEVSIYGGTIVDLVSEGSISNIKSARSVLLSKMTQFKRATPIPSESSFIDSVNTYNAEYNQWTTGNTYNNELNSNTDLTSEYVIKNYDTPSKWYPTIGLYIDADWVGIKMPCADPEITKGCALTDLGEGQKKEIEVSFKNNGDTDAVVELSMSCPSGGDIDILTSGKNYVVGSSSITESIFVRGQSEGSTDCTITTKAVGLGCNKKDTCIITFNVEAECVRDEDCVAPFNWNRDTCSCECNKDADTCPTGTELNDRTCICEDVIQCTKDSDCPRDKPDCQKGKCVPAECPAKPKNSVWEDEITCDWECKEGYEYDKPSDECIEEQGGEKNWWEDIPMEYLALGVLAIALLVVAVWGMGGGQQGRRSSRTYKKRKKK